MPDLDFTDSRVREMLDRDHQPEEVWAMSGTLLAVYCGMCGRKWPCEVRLILDSDV